MKVVLQLRGLEIDIERTFELPMPPRREELWIFRPWQLFTTPATKQDLHFRVEDVAYEQDRATDEIRAIVICYAVM
jgi:hypothetical protein